MTPSEKAAFNARQTLIGPHGFAAIQYARAASSPSFIPVQAGYRLGTFPIAEVHENMGFAFDIAINEPDIVGLIPAFLLIRSFAGEVLQVINELARFL